MRIHNNKKVKKKEGKIKWLSWIQKELQASVKIHRKTCASEYFLQNLYCSLLRAHLCGRWKVEQRVPFLCHVCQHLTLGIYIILLSPQFRGEEKEGSV